MVLATDWQSTARFVVLLVAQGRPCLAERRADSLPCVSDSIASSVELAAEGQGLQFTEAVDHTHSTFHGCKEPSISSYGMAIARVREVPLLCLFMQPSWAPQKLVQAC